MALQLRRGTDAERQGITPESGEPIWTTDTKELWIGDGSTAGGIAIGGAGPSGDSDQALYTTSSVKFANLTITNTATFGTSSYISITGQDDLLIDPEDNTIINSDLYVLGNLQTNGIYLGDNLLQIATANPAYSIATFSTSTTTVFNTARLQEGLFIGTTSNKISYNNLDDILIQSPSDGIVVDSASGLFVAGTSRIHADIIQTNSSSADHLFRITDRDENNLAYFTQNNVGIVPNLRAEKGMTVSNVLSVGGAPLDANGKSLTIYNSTLSATALLGNYSAGTEGPVLLRAYGQNRTGGTATTNPQPTFLAEGARGTGASPTTNGNGSLIANFAAGGYDGNKWTSDYETTASNNLLTTGALFFFANEAWTNALGSGAATATNVGTGMALQVQPTGFRMDQNSRQRLIQTTWTAGSSNIPPVLNINLGNGNNSTPTLTNAAGTVQHTGYGRTDIIGVNSTFRISSTPNNEVAQFTGSISGTTLDVTAVTGGVISQGQRIFSGSAGGWGVVQTGTVITALGSGTGGTGTYIVSVSQTVGSTTLYSGPDNYTYSQSSSNIGFITSRGSGATGRRWPVKDQDNLGQLSWFATFGGIPPNVGTYRTARIEVIATNNYTTSTQGSRMDFYTTRQNSNNSSVNLSLSATQNEYTSDNHLFRGNFNVYDSTVSWPNINANTGTTIFYADRFEFKDNAQVNQFEINNTVPGNPTISLRPNNTEVISVSTVSGITVSKNIVPSANHTYNLGTANTAEFDQIYYNRTFGSFLNTATITPAAADVDYILPIDRVTTSSNMTLSNTGTITIQQAGYFNIQFSLQLNNSDNQEHAFDIWLRKNGADVEFSNTQYDLLKSAKSVAALNYVEYFAANDTFELAYAVNNTAITMASSVSTSTPYVRPATPSIILTVVPVGA